MNRLLCGVTAIFFLLGVNLPVSAQERAIAGSVARIQGIVVASGLSGSVRLANGGLVFEDDTLETGPNGRVEIQMADDAVLTLGPDTVFVIDDYLFVGPGEGSVSMRLLKGAFRAVSGLIKGGDGQAFDIHTPVATIGIRGTDFWGGELDGAFNFALLGGAGIYVENGAGRVDIQQIGYGTTVMNSNVAPTVPVQWESEKVGRAVDTVRFR